MELFHPTRHEFPLFMHLAEHESDMINVKLLEAKRNIGMGGHIADKLIAVTDAGIKKALDDRALEREQRLQVELGEVNQVDAEHAPAAKQRVKFVRITIVRDPALFGRRQYYIT